MVSLLRQGQGIGTAWKERGLEAMLSINMSIANRGQLGRFPYFHFDLNCGSGCNTKANCKGSPMAFLDAAQQIDKRCYGYFVDQNEEATRDLRGRLEGSKTTYIFCGDNADFVPMIPGLVRAKGERPEYALGSIFCDPNGVLGVPFRELHRVLKMCPRLDVIVNYSSVTAIRCRAAYPERFASMPRLRCFPRVFGKRYWLIRRVVGVYKHSMLIGRNVKTGDYTKLGFYDLESPTGQELLSEYDEAKHNDVPCPLSDVCTVSSPPCISGSQSRGDGKDREPLFEVRSNGNGGASPEVPGVGDV